MRKLTAILLGGLAAGALDILYAFIVYGPMTYGVTPQRVLQSVAAGWIGRDASRAGEWNTALLGLGTHFLIATIMAAVFVLAASAFTTLSKRPILWGLVYGFILYIAMNYVVVPLSAAGANLHFAANMDEVTQRLQTSFSGIRPKPDPQYPWLLAGTIFTHTVLVGLPIALINARFAKE